MNKKEIKELKKIVKEIAEMEIKSLRKVEEITKKIREERKKQVEFAHKVYIGIKPKCESGKFKNTICKDVRTPRRIMNGGPLMSA